MNPLVNSSVPGDSSPETSDGLHSVSAGIDDAFRWNVRPSDKDPSKRWGVVVVALAAFGLGFLLFQNLLFGILGAVVILASTAEYWMGVSYKLDRKGASARCGLSLSSLEWGDVKRAITTDEGVKLSPLGNSGRMDAFRGVFLRFGKDRDKVLETVRRWLPTNVELMGG
jgi:hypothetical protein